jgi:glycosyltransferase A (GT-A) superfamily protein (DUF2064 family)
VAALAAADADVVLGPGEDGGYWALGLRAPCTAAVARALGARLAAGVAP